MSILYAAAGLIMLIGGGELLVRGAVRLASSVGISRLVIGLTVVAFGTSAPELGVSVTAVLAGQPDIAVGNVVGSGIVNILFILGLAAIIAPISVSRQLIRWDVPVMIAVTAFALLLSIDGFISTLDGSLLAAGLIAYTLWSVRTGRKESASAEETSIHGDRSLRSTLLAAGAVVSGLTLLLLGSRWLVEGAVEMARHLGVSELVIGLTVVAVGTSLPELTTSLVASVRGESEIAVGNVVGSNIFNMLLALGCAALVVPGGIPMAPSTITFDLPVLLAVSVACLPVFFHEGSINRWEGALFLAYFIAYVMFLFLDSTHHDMLPMYSEIMLYFVIPLTAVTLGLMTWQYGRRSSSDA